MENTENKDSSTQVKKTNNNREFRGKRKPVVRLSKIKSKRFDSPRR